MAYYECIYKDDHINIGDKFNVSLTGSHNLTTTATVCYINKNIICLLGNISLGTTDWPTQCTYTWNYTVNIKNKDYTGTCRIPTLEQLSTKCAGYKRDFHYWTSTIYDGSYSWIVGNDSTVYISVPSDSHGTIPFIEITL